MTYKIC